MDWKSLFYGLIFFSAVVMVFWLLNHTYKVKNRGLYWSLILIPPWIMSLWFWIPIERCTGLEWGAAWLIAMVAVVTGLISLVRIVLDITNTALYARLIRPALVVAIFFLAEHWAQWSPSFADDFAEEAAKTIQRDCQSSGLCPATCPGWTSFALDPNMMARLLWYPAAWVHGGKGTLRYPIFYVLNPQQTRFRIVVFHVQYHPLIYGLMKGKKMWYDYGEEENGLTCRGKYTIFSVIEGGVGSKLIWRDGKRQKELIY